MHASPQLIRQGAVQVLTPRFVASGDGRRVAATTPPFQSWESVHLRLWNHPLLLTLTPSAHPFELVSPDPSTLLVLLTVGAAVSEDNSLPLAHRGRAFRVEAQVWAHAAGSVDVPSHRVWRHGWPNVAAVPCVCVSARMASGILQHRVTVIVHSGSQR